MLCLQLICILIADAYQFAILPLMITAHCIYWTGIAGNVRYPNLWHRNPLDAYVPPQPETDNYIVMDVNDDSITF